MKVLCPMIYFKSRVPQVAKIAAMGSGGALASRAQSIHGPAPSIGMKWGELRCFSNERRCAGMGIA
jgi:hypothetical protein